MSQKDMEGPAIEAFHLREHPALMENRWREKNLLASEILQCSPLRQLRPEPWGDRTRLDLMWFEGRLGIRGATDETGSFVFRPLIKPDTAHPLIVEMMEQLEDNPLPIDKAQIRFRCHSENPLLCGIWIDAANESLKALKDESRWLSYFLDKGWKIEAGQKGKEFVLKPDGIHFLAAEPRPWLDSYDVNGEALAVLSCVASFSQPGPEVNRALIAAGFDLLADANIENLGWAEWGAGYGNLTAAYATRLGADGWSSEIDLLATDLLAKNASEFFPQLELKRSAAREIPDLPQRELWLLDPPRPGFPELLRLLPALDSTKPAWILIYHCHSKGLLGDSKLLRDAGYKLWGWSSVDAFPGTPHHEVISLWSLKT